MIYMDINRDIFGNFQVLGFKYSKIVWMPFKCFFGKRTTILFVLKHAHWLWIKWACCVARIRRHHYTVHIRNRWWICGTIENLPLLVVREESFITFNRSCDFPPIISSRKDLHFPNASELFFYVVEPLNLSFYSVNIEQFFSSCVAMKPIILSERTVFFI